MADRTAERPADRNRCGTLGNVTEQNEQRLFRTHRAVRVRQSGVAAAVVADILAKRHLADNDRKAERAEQIRAHGNDRKMRKCHVALSLLRLVAALADDHAYRRTGQTEHLTDLVFHIALIGEMEQTRVLQKQTNVGGQVDACVM